MGEERRAILRKMIFEDKKIVKAVGAHNGLSAKLVEKNGFDAIWASGFEISTSHAKPDANILTMSHFLEATRQIIESTSIPVIADCDSGFGDHNNVANLVREYEKIGVSAICIEDKTFPKINSFINKKQHLISIKEFCAKIVAAKKARKDNNLLIIARVESLIIGETVESALERARAYCAAGADLILIHSKSEDCEEIMEFSSKWISSVPLVIVPTTYKNITLDQIKGASNIRVVIYANQALRAGIKAIDSFLQILNQTESLESIDEYLSPMSHLFEIQGVNEMLMKEKKILAEVEGIYNVRV